MALATSAILFEIAKDLISIVDKVMDTLPDYAQRKRKSFAKIEASYLKLKGMSYEDDNFTTAGLYDAIVELRQFAKHFNKEIHE